MRVNTIKFITYNRYKSGTPLPLLMKAYAHATQHQTLAYFLCIQTAGVSEIYSMEF